MIIIPDIHGRAFWRQCIERNAQETVVFLGDYVDPYPHDNIKPHEALKCLIDIIQLKQSKPDSVTLLLGNHDLHYLDKIFGLWRYDEELAPFIQQLLTDNLDLFELTYCAKQDNVRYLFSHAGILQGWVESHPHFLKETDILLVGEILNDALHNEERYMSLMNALSDSSHYRSGTSKYGSPVWADLREHLEYTKSDSSVFQVFGHSLRPTETITPYFACLDCAFGFRLLPDGRFQKLCL